MANEFKFRSNYKDKDNQETEEKNHDKKPKNISRSNYVEGNTKDDKVKEVSDGSKS